MRTLLALIHIVVSVMMIFAVLIQQRKQGGFSGVFGGGTQADTGQWQTRSSLHGNIILHRIPQLIIRKGEIKQC